MSAKSIVGAYAQHGPAGLTEKGKNVRIACIAGATAGTALVITGIVIFILIELSRSPLFTQVFQVFFPLFLLNWRELVPRGAL